MLWFLGLDSLMDPNLNLLSPKLILSRKLLGTPKAHINLNFRDMHPPYMSFTKVRPKGENVTKNSHTVLKAHPICRSIEYNAHGTQKGHKVANFLPSTHFNQNRRP